MSGYSVQNDYDFNIGEIGFITERKPNPDWHIENLSNRDYYILAFCIEGQAGYKFDSQAHRIGKGDLLFFPKGFVHTAASDPEDPWFFYSIAFDMHFYNENTAQRFHTFDKILRSPNLYKLPAVLSELNHAWTGKRSGFLIKCRSLIMEILYLMIREMDLSAHNSSHFNNIEKIANMIQSNYTHDYSIDELSRISGLSSSHFRLLFKKITGLTAVQYQNSVRINKAKDLLLSGDCNVTEAAVAVGFNDIYYFSRMFKKVTGQNPSDYIKG